MKNHLKSKAMLAMLAARLTALNGLGVDPTATAGLAEMFKSASENNATPMMTFDGKETTIADVMKMAREKVPAAIHALNALRMENVDTYVRATLDFSSMYETVTLANNEQPVIENTYRNPVNVRHSGEDGGTRGVKAVKAKAHTYFNMRELHSDTVGYAMRDINQGTDVAAAAQGTVDVAWDVAHKLNTELFNSLQGGVINGKNYGQGVYRAFNFSTGSNLLKTLVPGPGIQIPNLPTTNLITAAAIQVLDGVDITQTVGQQFRFGVIRSVIRYCEQFRGIFPDGDIEPTGLIYVPSSETDGLLNQITPTGAFYNKVGESVLNSFLRVEYGGRVWTLVGSPFLPKGACYPVLNKKVGNLYLKPKFDFEHVESDVLKNYEERTIVKVYALGFLEPWRIHALKVVYSNQAGAGVVTTNF